MNVFNRGAKVQELRDKRQAAEIKAAEAAGALQAIRQQRDELSILTGKYQAQISELLVDNILAVKELEKSYVGNDYQNYDLAIAEIDKKYRGIADWGCLQTSTIIDLRAAFILGEGPQVTAATEKKEDAQRELDWCKDFFAYNGLDSEMTQEIAKEAEIEGKIALRLIWDEEPYKTHSKGMVSVRFISYLDKKYKVIANKNDYLWYEKMTWGAKGDIPAVEVEEPEFVYKKFGGRISDPNDAQPRIQRCLTQIDRLDRALRDLREINHILSSPTPDFQVDDMAVATQMLALIKDTNWRIGKAIVHVGQFKMVGPDSAGIMNLVAEIELLVKMISGTTSIPIHYLGLLDLLKNRATGDNTRELVMAATTRERAIWVGAFEELIDKAMVMYNQKTGTVQKSTDGGKLIPDNVSVVIPQISQEHWDHIRDVYIPAQTAGIISRDTVAAQIPGVDVGKEKLLREESDAREDKKAQEQLEQIRAEREAAANAPVQSEVKK
ncbi:MAG: hypothetical protein WC455_19275 [Dehalococcoidia bacterium]